MPTVGAYEFKLAAAASPGGVIDDENRIAKGEWAWIDREPKGASRRWLSVYTRCPDCGILATLWRSYGDDQHGHQIDAQGSLFPSVGCPHPPCGFHTHPTKLVDFVDRR